MDPFTLRSIVAGTDLSERSDDALRAAAAIAELTDAALHVLHAYELEAVRGGPGGAPATFPERVTEAERALEDQVRRVVPGSLRVASQRVEVYLPYKAILEEAQRVSADLIVLGRHRGGEPRAILGTTADHVVRESTVPCLVVPGALRLPLRAVLVPLDPSKPAPGVARLALSWASALGAGAASRPGTEVHMTMVLPESMALAPGLEDTVRAAVEEELATAAGPGAFPAGVGVRWVSLRNDSPARGILRYAEEVDADLVVMGTSAPGAVRRAILGSVASAVAKSARAPVLLVPLGQVQGA
ncbi:MAG TPA: universal stress protein [Longimicrobiales bacterium]